MIVITGPGRSGTSFLADLYRKLKFDPGGAWDKKIRAGREAADVVELNNNIGAELKVPMGPPPRPAFGEQQWHLVPELAERYGPRLREVSERYEVVKDPRFSWTLRVWLEAQAKIDHVIVTTRRLEDLMKSARFAGMARQEPTEEERNAPKSTNMFRIGAMLTAIGDYRVPHTIIWFPDYLSDPERLYEQLVFPKPVSRRKFLRAFRRTVDPKLVHFGAENALTT